MNTSIYAKTDKGREEIATRQFQLAPKLRTLLVMIDGRQSLGSLMEHVAGIGLSEESVDSLLRDEYITLISGGAAAVEAEPSQASRAPVSARARMLARSAARQGKRAGDDGPASELMDAPPQPDAQRAPADNLISA
jgi:hypothetical protein